MKRHYFISDDLQDLEAVERQLEENGITLPQIHVLSHDDQGAALLHLHQVEAVLRKNVVHGTERGAVIGIIAAAVVLMLAWWSGLTATYTWVPAIFLAVIVLGFCTWEGGLIGIQEPHIDFRRFEDDLRTGKHILFIDADPHQEEVLRRVVAGHPRLISAGEGASTPRWVVRAQDWWARFMQLAP